MPTVMGSGVVPDDDRPVANVFVGAESACDVGIDGTCAASITERSGAWMMRGALSTRDR
jgi:hypothetical protein